MIRYGVITSPCESGPFRVGDVGEVEQYVAAGSFARGWGEIETEIMFRRLSDNKVDRIPYSAITRISDPDNFNLGYVDSRCKKRY